MTRRKLRRTLYRMADQLHNLEMREGAHFMMGSRLNHEYEKLLELFEMVIGKPFTYSPDC